MADLRSDASILAITAGVDPRTNTWWEDVGDTLAVETHLDELVRYGVADFQDRERGFDPYQNGYLKGYEKYMMDFQGVESKKVADQIKQNIDMNNARRARTAKSGRFLPNMLGAMAAPENLALAFVPAAPAATLLGTGVKTGAAIGATELAMELGYRRQLDPSRTLEESIGTVAGGTLLGGAFHAAGVGIGRGLANRATKKQQAALNAAQSDFNNQVLGQTGTPAPLAVTQGEELFTALRSSGFNAETKILMNNDQYRQRSSGASASSVAPAVIQNQVKDVMKNLLRVGGVKDTDPLVVAYKAGVKSKKKNAFNEFYDLFDERVKQYGDPNLVFGVNQQNQAARKYVLDYDRATLRMDNLRQLQSATRDGYIGYSEQVMKRNWDQYQKGGPTIDDKLTARGLKPLSDFGITGFKDFTEYREFILRHELWHQSMADTNYKKGSRASLAKRDLEENLANENAAKDFLEWRNHNNKLQDLTYKSEIMRKADGAFGGYISKTQGKVADFMQLRASNSPMNSTFRRTMTQMGKDLGTLLTGDQSLITANQLAGRNIGSSIQSSTKVWQGHAVTAHNRIREQYNLYLGLPKGKKALYTYKGQANPFPNATAKWDEFIDQVGRTLNSGVPHANSQINNSVKAINDFYAWGQREAEISGILRMQGGPEIDAAILQIEDRLADMNKEMIKKLGPNTKVTPTAVVMFNPTAKKQDATWKAIRDFREKNPELTQQFTFLSNRRHDLLDEQAYARSIPKQDQTDYFRRVYNTAAIRANREFFTDMVEQSFLKQPKIWVKRKGWKDTDPATSRERAEEAVRRILGEDDIQNKFGGEPGSMRHRVIPLKNHELVEIDVNGEKFDFIQVDPIQNMMNYAHSTGSYSEFAKRFRSSEMYLTPDEVFARQIDEMRRQELKAGNDPKTVDKITRDMMHLKEAVTHRIVTNPDSMSREVVTFIKSLTHLSTMGGSGLSAANEAASIYLVHGMERLMKAVSMQHGNHLNNFMAKHEGELTRMGSLVDIAQGVSNTRFEGGQFESSLRTAPNRVLRNLASKMFVFNGMGPITMKLKSLTGVLSVDRLMGGIADEFNVGGRGGKRPDDVDYGTKMGMPRAMRKRIANMLEEHWDDIYHTDEDIYSVDSRQWSDAGAARAFQEHVVADIENTIIMANPSTKWKVMDGVVHVPVNDFTTGILGKQGHKIQGGYYAIEHPGISLPFMYLSWPLAAANKVGGKMIRGEYAAPMGFLIATVALSYFIQEFKGFTRSANRGFIPFEQKVANAVYYSNTSNILADYYDKSSWLATAVARDMGAEEFDARVPNLQFLDVEGTGKTVFDMATGPAISKIVDTVAGDMGDIRRAIPLNQMPFFAQLLRMIEEGLAQ